MAEILVSVIVMPSPTSDGRACVESIKAQTLKGIEVIDADDWTSINGKYIYIISADDMILDNGLEILFEEADASDADIVHSMAFIERNGNDISIVSDKPSTDDKTAQKNLFAAEGFHLSPSLNLYRREFIEQFQLNWRAGDAFSYAAFNLAAKMIFTEEYFYVKNVLPPPAPVVDDDPNTLVKNLRHDEFRDGFLVTTQRKKLWNVQLHLIEEFARICQKYDLKWFAYAGTLLGAVRHNGFIPWDDDVDLALFRPDYEKLKRVIADELKPEYSLDFWYDYAVEGERNPDNLPTISKKVFDSNAWWPSSAGYFKIRDNRTSMIEYPDRPNVNQGMCIDIFPLDPAPPFDNQKRADDFKFITALMLATGSPDALNLKQLPSKEKKYFKALLKKPFRERALEYEKFLAEHWFESEYVSHINSIFAYRREYAWKYEYWRKLIGLPFEKIVLPAPIAYDEVLKAHYGNWHEMYITHSHFADYSADIKYDDYFKEIAPEILALHLKEKEALADG